MHVTQKYSWNHTVNNSRSGYVKLRVICLCAWWIWIMLTTRLCITSCLTMFLKQSRQSSHYCLDKMVPDTAGKNWAVFRQRMKVCGSNSAEEFTVAVRRWEIVLTNDGRWCTHWLIDVIPNKHAVTVNQRKFSQLKSLGTYSKLKCVSDHPISHELSLPMIIMLHFYSAPQTSGLIWSVYATE